MSRLIGIDLGTTNSCVAVMEGGESVVIPTAEGQRTTPSIVAFTQDGQRLVGITAKRQATVNSQRTISSIKREMGSDFKVKIDGKTYSPPEISAMILQKLKTDAEAYLGEPVRDAVITVPAYFTDSQRQATKDAGRIAGLNVQRIINEPTAAALAYGVDKEQAQRVMVYDLGGGTFDVSILDINNGVIEVMATAGNNRLGGDDFDKCVVDYLLKEFRQQNKIDLSKDPTALARIREAAEQAKIELSGAQTTQINLPFISSGKNGPLHFETSLTRAKFNELTSHLVQKTLDPVRQALRDSGLDPSQLAKVLLVGGSTRIPAVQEAVKKITHKDPFKGINPDECVAMGASLQGGVLAGTVKDLLLLDVTPLSLGIETLGGVCTVLIERNSTIPVQKRQIFTTAAPYQSSVDIHVLQGERPMAWDNKTLGRFRLSGIRRAPRGVPQIEVTFEIDANGIVSVSARDLDTGQQQSITLTTSSNLSQSEIDRAMREARQYQAEDQARRREAEAEQNLEMLIYQAGVLLKQLPKEQRPPLEEALKQARQAKRGKNMADKLTAYDRLRHELDQAQANAPGGGYDDPGAYGGGGSMPPEEENYDAEYEPAE